MFAHIVGGVHFEGERIGFLLNYVYAKTKKDEPENTKKNEAVSSSFRVLLSSVFACTSMKNQFLPLQNGPLQQCEQRLFLSSSVQQVLLAHKQKTKKVEDRGLPLLVPNAKYRFLTDYSPAVNVAQQLQACRTLLLL